MWEGSSTCSNTTKGAVGEEASMSYMGKGARVLWKVEHASGRYTLTQKRMDYKRNGGNICGL